MSKRMIFIQNKPMLSLLIICEVAGFKFNE